MENKFTLLLHSRKFWAALAGLLVVILREFVADFPVDDEQLIALIVVIASYILGTAIEDAGRGDYLTVLPKDDGVNDCVR